MLDFELGGSSVGARSERSLVHFGFDANGP
jgi:hypothetical protein